MGLLQIYSLFQIPSSIHCSTFQMHTLVETFFVLMSFSFWEWEGGLNIVYA